MSLFYDVIFVFYALFYLPYLLVTNRWYPGFGMRFGVFSAQVKQQIKAKTNIWVHAVSVGEVMAVEGLLEQLSQKYPACQLILTVTTKTGFLLARERLEKKVLVLPSPIDLSFVAAGFVSMINPKIYIAVETEIWPNLYRELARQHVALVVINGRISDASFGRYKAIRFLLKSILKHVSRWCMQSQRDADRIVALGADPSLVSVTGNIKFDDIQRSENRSFENLKSGNKKFWWVAGSTHPGEEEIVLNVYQKVLKDDPSWGLIIAPRHIERTPQVLELIFRRGFQAVKFSEISRSCPANAIIVVDTLGQLRSLYALASLVFVGKSLCVGGGHNVIEPAFYGKAIVIGPRTENFRDMVACFKEKNAIVQVEDAYSFEINIRALCDDPLEREAIGNAAKKVITENQGATRRSLERLADFIK